jgi:predicted HNH restriction endonuclease
VWTAVQKFLDLPATDANAVAGSVLPEEIVQPDGLTEGAVRTITVNAYERNPEARRRCIAYYGPSCVACGFDFGVTYGSFAEGFIHVHHVKPLSEIGTEYEVDPVADLRPVCPNCHAVIHLGGGCRSIDEIRRLLGRETT